MLKIINLNAKKNFNSIINISFFLNLNFLTSFILFLFIRIVLELKHATKEPFFPINSEQLSLFETDNILKNKESGFNYFAISPKKVISAIKKSL